MFEFTPRSEEAEAFDERIRLRKPGDHVFVEEIGDGLEIWRHTTADPPYCYLMYRPPSWSPDGLQRVSAVKAGDPDTLKRVVDQSPIRVLIKRRNRPDYLRRSHGRRYYNQEDTSFET